MRLTAAFLLFAVGALGVAALATIQLIKQETLGTLDATLLEEATTIAPLVDLPEERLKAAVHEVGSETDLGAAKFVGILRTDGSVRVSSRKIPESARQRYPRGVKRQTVATAGKDEAMYRVAWAPARTGETVVVGVHASHAVRLVRRARWVIALIGLALLVVLGGAAWGITSRAATELDRLAGEIATLEAGSLARRLTVRRTDEVDRLVTVLNRVLERLERSVDQLRRFTADAAHELRTPLAAMRARLEVALAEDSATVARDHVVDALEQAERLSRLAEDLLMLARVEGGAVASRAMEGAVDVSALVDEVGTALAPIAEEQGRPFRWAAAPDLVVRGSEPLLKRVLLNLVDNAFRHTPASARVDVRARRDGAQVVVEVSDAGPGIDPAIRPHVFERFRHGAQGGTGLGLALVREIVDRHGGHVVLDGDTGRGTTARVVLAAAVAEGRARA